jgi:hypothetical protein
MRSRGITPVLINTPFHLVSPNPEFNVNDIGKYQEAHKALILARSFEPENILFQLMNFNDKGHRKIARQIIESVFN